MVHDKPVTMLLDTGAHVSVLPQNFILNTVDLDNSNHKGRLVRAFGGQEIQLFGPVCVQINVCGLDLVHPFYYLDDETPAIIGYDLMKAAHLILDTHSQQVWSLHPGASQRLPWPKAKQGDAPADIFVDSFDEGNTTPKLCDMENTSSETIPRQLNPTASEFQPLSQDEDTIETCFDITNTVETDDRLPPHINLLYETTTENTHLTADVDEQFKDLLRRHEKTFAKDSTDLGYCTALPHDIDTGDSPPIKQSLRRPPLSAGDVETEIIDQMLTSGVIEPSTSAWASPVCLVKKPDNTYRFCIDYRRVNAVSRKDGFPVPDIQDALDSLRGARWFATIDLLSGYWQLGLTDRAKERSAFCTRRGLYQFCRMPFGLCGAPATFCRLMTKVLGDHIGNICLCYLDDVIVYGKTQRELLERLDIILTRLNAYGLKVKPSKCVFLGRRYNFLDTL